MYKWRKQFILGFGIILSVILNLFSMHVVGQSENVTVARLIVFHSPSCSHCRAVVENTLPELQIQYGDQLEIQLYNLAEPEGHRVFAALREAVPDTSGAIPQAYIDTYILIGSQQIPEKLPEIIDACLEKGGCDWAFTVEKSLSGNAEPTNTPISQYPVYFAYVYDAGCLECDAVSYDLDELSRQYDHLEIRRYDVRYDAAIIDAMGTIYNIPENIRLLAPAVFSGTSYLGPDDISYSKLVAIVKKELEQQSTAPWEGINEETLQSSEERITQRFSQFSVLAIAGAGLLDGLNPCAFTTIIFFVSYLTLVGRQGREILTVGFAFTLAVYLSYLAMGLGLSVVIESLRDFSWVSRLIYGGTAIFCLGLAVISLNDWHKIRQGKLSDITLQLPKMFKQRIHGTIRQRSRVQGYVGAAFIAGIIISVFELACTGQVYLPTIVFMTSVEDLRMTAL